MLCWHFRQWIYLTNSCSAAFCSLNGRLAGCAFILKCFSHCRMIFAFRLCHQSFSVPKILFIQHIFNLITPLQWILNQLERRTMQQKRQNRKNNAKNHKKCMETIWNKMELKRKRTHGGPKVVNFHSCSVNIEQSHLWGWLYLSLSRSRLAQPSPYIHVDEHGPSTTELKIEFHEIAERSQIDAYMTTFLPHWYIPRNQWKFH